ncbi:MAG TPA: endonuclease/exonuclease/phosphatase family protein, partial [Armatimonadota bacterium]
MRTPPKRRSHPVLPWAAGYLAALLLLWAAEELVGERFWLSTLAAYAPAALYALPMAVLVPLVVIRRDARGLLLLLPCTLILTFPLGNLAIHGAPPSRTTAALSVMTYNIHGGRAGVDRLAAEIRAARPEIACLQETRGFGERLKRALPEYNVAAEGDVAIISRPPITSRRRLTFDSQTIWRSALEARTMWNGRPIRVIAVHFVVGPRHASKGFVPHWSEAGAARLEQVDQLLRWVKADETRTIIAGDFNMPPRGLAYRLLTAQARGGFADAGLGFGATYPANRPLLRIDHILTAHGPRAIDAWVQP